MSFAFLFSLTTFKAINVVFLVGIVSYPSVKKQKKTGNHWTITNHKKKKKKAKPPQLANKTSKSCSIM